MSQETQPQTENKPDSLPEKTETTEQAQAQAAPDFTPEISPELAAMIDEATLPADERQALSGEGEPRSSATIPQISYDMDEDECAALAMQGLQFTMGMLEQKTGVRVPLNQVQVMVFTALVTPCMMKYGPSVKRMLANMEVSDEGYMPEICAAGGVASIAVPTVVALHKAKKARAAAAKAQRTDAPKKTEPQKASKDAEKDTEKVH